MAGFAPEVLAKMGYLLSESPGISYFVDDVNGLDANNGLSWATAFKTIQKAITTQIAESSGLGDVIYVAPGNYAESLTGDLTRVSIIGIPGRYPWHIASVRPTGSYAYYGTLFEAMIKNLMLLSPSALNTEFPAVQLVDARYSVIEDCHFIGRMATPSEVGLQIGNRDAVATHANFDYCIIRRNRFDTIYGTASEFDIGIKLGRVGYDAGCSVKQMVGTIIEDNIVHAKTIGIYIGVYCNDYSVIRRNVVDSMQAENGCATAGIQGYGGYPMICDNRINATDAIIAPGALIMRTLWNCVSNAGTPAMELPVST